jgi:hypothetical protein
MESRAGWIWWWVHTSFTVLVRLGVVGAAFVVAYGRWGGWVASIVSLGLLTVLAPTVITLLCVRWPGFGDERAKKLILRMNRIRLIAAICLLVASLVTGPVGLWVFCAVCALWALLSWAVMKMALSAGASA